MSIVPSASEKTVSIPGKKLRGSSLPRRRTSMGVSAINRSDISIVSNVKLNGITPARVNVSSRFLSSIPVTFMRSSWYWTLPVHSLSLSVPCQSTVISGAVKVPAMLTCIAAVMVGDVRCNGTWTARTSASSVVPSGLDLNRSGALLVRRKS